MSQYRQFQFKEYSFDASTKQAVFTFGFDDQVAFTERFTFNFDFVDYSPEQLDRALQNLFFMAGVSYYKAYLAPEIVVQAGQLDATLADFYERTYQRGLGEFFFVNTLDPRTPIGFSANTESISSKTTDAPHDGLLIGLGGGKDSLVTVELLRDQPRVATWSLGHESQLAPLVERIGLPHLAVERHWDKSLLDHNAQGAYNGHVPISAIFACVGTVVTILSGYGSVVVSNENSANEPTLQYEGLDINHQFSKSLAFEKDYQAVLAHCFGDNQQYFSFLRPLSELRIGEVFAKVAFEKYRDVFSSCNRAFVHTSDKLFWCGECAKCAFIFLSLTPFIERSALESLWNGKNLLLDPDLEPMYRKLLGIEGDKPLDCVGEVKESRAAMRLAQSIYPALEKYSFDLPEDYDYKALAAHSMPVELYEVLLSALPGSANNVIE